MRAKDRGLIPLEAREAQRRKTKRRAVSVIIRCMGEEDMGFAQIANRLDQSEQEVRQWVYDMIEGVGGTLNEVSDLLLAMDCEAEFGARKIEWRKPAPAPETPSE